MLTPTEYEITSGYIGSFGVTYQTATEKTLREAISMAAKRSGTTEDAIERRLETGDLVAWCDSPNYHYDHGTGYIRRKRTAPPPERLVQCDCGHSVPQVLVMSASMGTSCPDCYDRMSD